MKVLVWLEIEFDGQMAEKYAKRPVEAVSDMVVAAVEKRITSGKVEVSLAYKARPRARVKEALDEAAQAFGVIASQQW